MSVKTNNIYGKIVISNKTIERFVFTVLKDCYGIVRFVPTSVVGSIRTLLHFGSGVNGVKVKTSGDRIFIDVGVVVKFGVSINAVVDALKESMKYRVEKFTGMIVDTMNIKIMAVER